MEDPGAGATSSGIRKCIEWPGCKMDTGLFLPWADANDVLMMSLKAVC